MPRAENRKKPPNMLGGSKSGGFNSQQDDHNHQANKASALNKKAELLEKMKNLQGKNTDKV